MELDLVFYILLSGVIFCLGLTGVIIRKNLITMFLSAELMLAAVNINFAAFARYHGDVAGQIFVIFVMAVAAAEAAVGLALFICLYRNKETINVDEINALEG